MEKINKLKTKFQEYNLDGYLIPKNDEFFSEYVPHDKDDLQYISNFSGSYGLALILKKNNFLFVDGRYSVQAEIQSGRKFRVLTLPFTKKKFQLNFKNKKIGYDPKLFNKNSIKYFSQKLGIICVAINNNLVRLIKKKEINEKKNKFFYTLDKSITGANTLEKIKSLRNVFKKNDIDIMFVTSSENIAWLLNIRGSDSDFSPTPNSFLLIDKQMRIFLFCDLKKISSKFQKKLSFINILGINKLESLIKIFKNKKFLIDGSTCSIFYKDIIEKNNTIKKDIDPIYYLKAQKNDVEIYNTKKIHEYDGAALTKFLFWIQNNFKKEKITELMAQKKLLSFRKKFKKFKFPSFPTISSTGPNGAIVHYNASKKTNRVLKSGSIYLVDSGGQYHYGTTDVTRTISLDTKNKKIKEVFTRVLQGHLNLSNYKITKSTTGSILDKIARKKLKKINLDYAHGTGHGVGYFLNVHEGPHAISKNNNISFQRGMIVSNEPGYYEKNKFGIRIENLIYVKGDRKGNTFENLTMAPIEKDLIIRENLNKNEKRWLNNYHKTVFRNLVKSMNKIEVLELKKACSAI